MSEILIVEDERTVRDGYKDFLKSEGYDVRTAIDGEDALKKIEAKRPDLVLLDVMMPKLNGFRCCETIREKDALLPVIFLTAKDSEADVIRAKNLGCDDFVSKSESDELLLACVRRALARAQQVDEAYEAKLPEQICLGNTIVDVTFLTVTEKGKLIAHLTRTEANILSYLDQHRGQVVVFDDLISALRGSGFACEDNMLYSHVSRVRTKLGKAGDLLRTTRGIGYSLVK